MDRTLVYPSALPRSQDFLQAQKDAIYGLGHLAQAILGSSTVVSGLLCAPTLPASLQVIVGAGSLYALEEVDATAYSTLGVDTTNIVKQGLLVAPATLTITPPLTSGYSQVFLIEVAYEDLDGGSTVLPYLNPANPNQPYAGPSNSGTSQFTIRQGICVVALKAGTAAPTGSQVTPAPDAGYTALYAITVANGQASITSANIATLSGAPFITLKLPQVPAAIQAQAANYAVDTGTANAMAVALPAYTSVQEGLRLSIKKGGSANAAGTLTLAVNGGTPGTVLWADGSALAAGDWPANSVGNVVAVGAGWQLDSIAGPSVFARISASGPVVSDQSLVHYGVDTGTANAVTVSSVSPALTGGMVPGIQTEVTKSAAANTAAMTATIAGASGSVMWADGSALQAGDWPASTPAVLEYDGTNFRIQSVMGPTVYARVSSITSVVHYGTDTGTANALSVASVSPGLSSVGAGAQFEITKAAVTNTGAMTATIAGQTGAVQWADGSPLAAGDWPASTPGILYFDGTNYNLTSVMGPKVWKRAGWLPPYALFQKVRPSNVAPVAFPANTWNIWEHNTTVINTIPGCVLNSDGSVIIPPGTYRSTFTGVIWAGYYHWCRLWWLDDLFEFGWGHACSSYVAYGGYPTGGPSAGTTYFTVPNNDPYNYGPLNGGFGGRKAAHHHICYGFAGALRGINVLGFFEFRDATWEIEKLA